jgi:amidase
MKLSDYAAQDGLGLAHLIKSKQIAPREGAEAALEAIANLNPKVGAVIEAWPDEIDKALKHQSPDAPFYGVPITIKDLVINVEGQLCEAGSRLAAGLRSDHDTDLMKRFRASGVVPIARSKSPELGFSPTTENILHGPVHNPWDLTRSAGGSSGGSGAAVACGMVPIGHASDGGGSIRIPAALNGLVGLKPTRGRVPIGPDSEEGLLGLGVELIVSRSVRDTAAMLDCVQGGAPGDPYVIAPPVRPYSTEIVTKPKRLRIGVLRGALWGGQAPTDAVAKSLEATAQLCADLGHEIIDEAPGLGVSFDQFILGNARIWCTGLAHWTDLLCHFTGRAPDLSTLEPATLACSNYGHSVSALELLEALDVCNLVTRSFGLFFQRCDLLLLPTMPDAAPKLGSYNVSPGEVDGLGWTRKLFDRLPFTPAFNVSGMPAISLPLAETPDGMPIGIQFGADFGREDLLLQIAAQMEQARPWAGRRPPIFVNELGV